MVKKNWWLLSKKSSLCKNPKIIKYLFKSTKSAKENSNNSKSIFNHIEGISFVKLNTLFLNYAVTSGL